MQEIIKILIGVVILFLAWPIGNHLAKLTHEELKSGRKWFKIIIIVCALGAIASLIILNDILLFTFLFILIVTQRCLVRRSIKKKNK